MVPRAVHGLRVGILDDVSADKLPRGRTRHASARANRGRVLALLADVFDRAAGLMEQRFLRNAFLPVLLFLPAVTAPAFMSGAFTSIPTEWERQSATLKVLELLGYFTAVWFFAAILASQWRNVIQLFEGYPFRRWRRPRDWHAARLAQLDGSPEGWANRFYCYPTNDRDLLPTRLGNIMRAAERFPLDRYNAEGILVWTRLFPVIPPAFSGNVQDARARLEFLLVIALWFIGFGCLSAALLLLVGRPGLLATACFAVGTLGAYGAYRSALTAAIEYGERLRTGFELYRLDLLAQLKFKQPTNLLEEKQLWGDFFHFLAQGTAPPDGWTYADPPQSSTHVRLTLEPSAAVPSPDVTDPAPSVHSSS